MTARRWWLWISIAAAATAVILLAAFASVVPLRSDTLRRRIVETLSSRLNSEVTLDDLSLHVFPRLRASGSGLLIRQRGRADVPPLIAIRTFTVDTDLLGAWRRRVAHVELEGLDISIPPDRDDDNGSDDDSPHVDPDALSRSVVIETLVSKQARLIIVPRNAAKKPKIWAIHSLEMHRVGAANPWPFSATLTNGVPPGEIVTHGTFGPWDANEPGHTPLRGDFSFDNADLGVFKGIRGTLSSRGSFGGSLDHIDVTGETDTPDFTVEAGGHPFALHTKYHSIVDGTNGDTLLERIDATFLKSTLVASGAVLDGPKGEKGRTVSLNVTMSNARIEDVLKMAVKEATPPMIGALKLTTTFLLPPGETDVVDRLRLAGSFALTDAKFANAVVQQKIVELSRRGRGRPGETAAANVASMFRGRFALRGGRLDLHDLAFAVPGAQVRLAGTYALKRETLSFKGQLLLDARVSETVEGGFKSMLLKIADPLFGRRGGGSAIPIKIEGTRSDPQFGVDIGRVFKRGT